MNSFGGGEEKRKKENRRGQHRMKREKGFIHCIPHLTNDLT